MIINLAFLWIGCCGALLVGCDDVHDVLITRIAARLLGCLNVLICAIWFGAQ